MLYCPNDHKGLTQFMMTQGMMRLQNNAELEGSRMVTNVFNAYSLLVHQEQQAAR